MGSGSGSAAGDRNLSRERATPGSINASLANGNAAIDHGGKVKSNGYRARTVSTLGCEVRNISTPGSPS
jgi:hypothetical protein